MTIKGWDIFTARYAHHPPPHQFSFLLMEGITLFGLLNLVSTAVTERTFCSLSHVLSLSLFFAVGTTTFDYN
jgi:hypothetical protein